MRYCLIIAHLQYVKYPLIFANKDFRLIKNFKNM
jgi:hypothetical protein